MSDGQFLGHKYNKPINSFLVNELLYSTFYLRVVIEQKEECLFWQTFFV